MSVIRGVRVEGGEVFVLNYGFDPKRIHMLCPECGAWNLINDDQEAGRVSIVCDAVKRGTCTFHETHDFIGKRGSSIPEYMGPPESFDSDLAQSASRWIGIRLRQGQWPS